jgi:hypothetical protein
MGNKSTKKLDYINLLYMFGFDKKGNEVIIEYNPRT